MKEKFNSFLRALLWLVTGKSKGAQVKRRIPESLNLGSRVSAEKSKFNSPSLNQQQCISLIDGIGKILKDEASKRNMNVHIHVVPKTGKSPMTSINGSSEDGSNQGPLPHNCDNGSP